MPGEFFPLTAARYDLPKGDLGLTLFPGQTDEIDTTRQIGGVAKMKDRPSVFRMARAATTATAVYLVAACSLASAQNTSTPNDNATRPPPGNAAQGPALPHGVGEVVKMYQGGIDKDVIVNYVNSTVMPYHLNADGIIYLHTLGLPQEITKAMIVRDGQLQQQQQANQQYYQQQQQANQQYAQQQQPMPGAMPAPYGNMAPQPPVEVVTPSTPAPEVTVIGSDYGDYGYPYYGYGYPYYYGGPYYGYSWPLVVGGGWGWGHGWGYGGYRGGYGGFHGGRGFGGFHGGGGFGGFHGGGGGFRGGGGGGGFHGGGGGGGFSHGGGAVGGSHGGSSGGHGGGHR
jgi:hypothetical protein